MLELQLFKCIRTVCWLSSYQSFILTNLEIMHGDIKPQNVLIFKNDPNAIQFTAKVIDFGYSSRFASDEDCISMPKSPLWHAPEHRSPCTPPEARRMDLFSF